MAAYAIRFDFPESDKPWYAGMAKGAWGWAPTLATAETWSDREIAGRVLANAYGPSAEYGFIIEVEIGEVAAMREP